MRMVIVLLPVMASPRAWAGDDKANSLTVLPWSQASFSFSSDEKVAGIAYTQLFGGSYVLTVDASAPVDSDTRIAAFRNDHHLASGFSGSFQIGFDGRAQVLADLESALRREQAALHLLTSAGSTTSFSLEEAYVTRHRIGAGADAIARDLCGSGPCAAEDVARALCKVVASGTTASCAADPAQIMAQTDTVTQSVAETCGVVPSANEDRCFLALWWTHQQDLEHANFTVQRFAVNAEQLDQIWSVFSTLDPEQAKRYTGADKRAAIVANPKPFADALRAAIRTSSLQRRDLMLIAAPLDGRTAHALTLDASLSYDRMSVFQTDLAAAPVTSTSHDFSLGVDYTLYTPLRGLAFTSRVGFENSRSPGAGQVQRCQTVSSSKPEVSGTQCGSVLFRGGPQPDAQSSAFARVALTYQYGGTPSTDDLIPGAEVRAGVEGIFADKVLDLRLTLFGTPVKGTTAARVGVALDVTYAIDASTAKPWVVTPLVFVGATFADLIGADL